jgi:hypothetical protein
MGRYNVQLANTIIRKITIAAMAELEAAIASLSGAGVITGHNWTTAVPNGSNPTAPALTPIADLAAVIETNELRELGIVYGTLIISPQDMTILRLAAALGAVLVVGLSRLQLGPRRRPANRRSQRRRDPVPRPVAAGPITGVHTANRPTPSATRLALADPSLNLAVPVRWHTSRNPSHPRWQDGNLSSLPTPAQVHMPRRDQQAGQDEGT